MRSGVENDLYRCAHGHHWLVEFARRAAGARRGDVHTTAPHKLRLQSARGQPAQAQTHAQAQAQTHAQAQAQAQVQAQVQAQAQAHEQAQAQAQAQAQERT